MKRYRYVCSDSGMTCDVQLENQDEEKLRFEAEEHLRTHHPIEAEHRDQVEAIFAAGSKQAGV